MSPNPRPVINTPTEAYRRRRDGGDMNSMEDPAIRSPRVAKNTPKELIIYDIRGFRIISRI